MNKEQALEIVYAHEIDSLGDDERELLEANNPDLLAAYDALLIEAGLKDKEYR